MMPITRMTKANAITNTVGRVAGCTVQKDGVGEGPARVPASHVAAAACRQRRRALPERWWSAPGLSRPVWWQSWHLLLMRCGRVLLDRVLLLEDGAVARCKWLAPRQGVGPVGHGLDVNLGKPEPPLGINSAIVEPQFIAVLGCDDFLDHV